MEEENKSLEQDNINNNLNDSNTNSSSNGSTFLNAVNKAGNIASGISNLKSGNGGNNNPNKASVNGTNGNSDNNGNNGNNASKVGAAANLAGKALDVGAKFNPALKGLKIAKDIASKAGNTLGNIRAKNGPQLPPNNVGNTNNPNNSNNEGSGSTANKNSFLGGESDSQETSEEEGKAKGFSPLNIASTVAGGSSPVNLLFGGSIKVKMYLAIAGAVGSLIALLLPVLITAAFIGSFASLFSANTVSGGDTGDMDYIAATEDEAAYQERLERVISRYGDEGDANRVTAAEGISAGLSIIQQNDTAFSFDDMTESRMRQLADLVIEVKKNEQNDEEEFEAYSEEEAKANFVDYYRSYF